ncbi:UNVERIFIED_CONTAM: hypothetical protein FKN15_039732 [Acipenser sinensis]
MWRTFLPVLLLVTHYPFSTALFTVEMAKTLYLAEFGNTVKMECRFPTGGSLDSINVYWHRMLSNGSEYEVYTLLNGNQDLQSQHPEYKERVYMKPDLLRKGRAELEISNVKISDSGSYRCLIKMGGADYKQATLSVKGPAGGAEEHLQRVTVFTELNVGIKKESGFGKREHHASV